MRQWGALVWIHAAITRFPDTAWAEIDLDALRHNAGIVRQLAPQAKIMAMLKADAYGHGLLACAGALVEQVDGLAVARLDEAEQLRQRWPRKPLLLTAAWHDSESLHWCAQRNVAIVLHAPEQLNVLSGLSQWPPLWLKLNTGMNRMGFSSEALPSVMRQVQSHEQDAVLMSHFSSADEAEETPTRVQIQQFDALADSLPEVPQSMANSAGIIGYAASHRDWVRPGIMLYGSNPMQQPTSLDLRPVMQLKARILAINTVSAGGAVGYGQTWRAPRNSRIACVGIGYGDGYPRLTGRASAVVHGQRAPLAGRVSMDVLSLDVSNIPAARVGDEVELWGRNMSVDEVAGHADTISYDLLCRVAARVPRQN